LACLDAEGVLTIGEPIKIIIEAVKALLGVVSTLSGLSAERVIAVHKAIAVVIEAVETVLANRPTERRVLALLVFAVDGAVRVVIFPVEAYFNAKTLGDALTERVLAIGQPIEIIVKTVAANLD
jgi:hypothetical protein